MLKKLSVHRKNEISRKHVTILGVKVTGTSTAGVLRKVAVDIRKNHKFYIVTPNPEIVMAAQDDDDLMTALNSADIAIPDGIGLIAANKFLTLPNPKGLLTRTFTLIVQGLGVGFSVVFDRKFLSDGLQVIRGRELFLELIKEANKYGWRVYLLGGEHGEATGTKKVLEANFKGVKIMARQGPMLFSDATPKSKKDTEEQEQCIKEINTFAPQLLFVYFDHRKQEKWLYRHLKELNIGGGMVLGGTFKYMTGMQKLPPKIIADSGLEWLWRLLTRSQKIDRVSKAFPGFPFKIFLHKLAK